MVMDATISAVPGRSGGRRAMPRFGISLRGLIAFPVISLVALGSGIGFAEWTIDKAVKAHGLAAAMAWSRSFSPEIEGHTDDIITRQIEPLRVLVSGNGWQREGVTSLRLFDGRGRGLVASDGGDAEALSNDHNLDAVRVIGSGQGFIRIAPAARSAMHLAEAFVPLRLASGELVAVAVVTLDETAEASRVRAEVYGLTLKFASLAASAAALLLAGIAFRRQGSAAKKTVPAAAPLTGPFDDWLVEAVEAAVRNCATPVEIECRLGLDALQAAGDASAHRAAIRQLLVSVFAADLAGHRVLVSSDVTDRGVEISVSPGGGMPAAELVQCFQDFGGGLDARPAADGPGMVLTAWWPAPISKMEAS